MIYNIDIQKKFYKELAKHIVQDNKNFDLSSQFVIVPCYRSAYMLKNSFEGNFILPRIKTLEEIFESDAILSNRLDFIKFKTKSIIKIYKLLTKKKNNISLNTASQMFYLLANNKSSIDPNFEYIEDNFKDINFYKKFQKESIEKIFVEQERVIVAGFNIEDEITEHLFLHTIESGQRIFCYGLPSLECNKESFFYKLSSFIRDKNFKNFTDNENHNDIQKFFFGNIHPAEKLSTNINCKILEFPTEHKMLCQIERCILNTLPSVALIADDDNFIRKLNHRLSKSNISLHYRQSLKSHLDGTFLVYILDLCALPTSGKLLLQLLKHPYIYQDNQEIVDDIEKNYVRILKSSNYKKEEALKNASIELICKVEEGIKSINQSDNMPKSHMDFAILLSQKFSFEGRKVINLMIESELKICDIKSYKKILAFFLQNHYCYCDKAFESKVKVLKPNDAMFLEEENIIFVGCAEEKFDSKDQKFLYALYQHLSSKNCFMFCSQQEFTSKVIIKMLDVLQITKTEDLKSFSYTKSGRASKAKQEFKLKKSQIPKSLTATMVELLINDPYKFYAKFVLKTKESEPIDKKPGSREFGNVVHYILQDCRLQKITTSALVEKFKHYIKLQYSNFSYTEGLWLPKFKKIAENFCQFHNKRLEIIEKIETEKNYSVSIRGYEISARIDRIEFLKDGTVAIVDFKTGVLPTIKSVKELVKPQLLVQGLVASSTKQVVSEIALCKPCTDQVKWASINKPSMHVEKLKDKLLELLD